MNKKYCEDNKCDKLCFDSQDEAHEYIKSHSGISSIKHIIYYCMSCNCWHYNDFIVDESTRWNDRI